MIYFIVKTTSMSLTLSLSFFFPFRQQRRSTSCTPVKISMALHSIVQQSHSRSCSLSFFIIKEKSFFVRPALSLLLLLSQQTHFLYHAQTYTQQPVRCYCIYPRDNILLIYYIHFIYSILVSEMTNSSSLWLQTLRAPRLPT